MSDRFIGLNRGSVGHSDSKITRGSSTGSTDVEVRIADAAGWTRKEVILALQVIIDDLAAPSTVSATQYPPK